MRTARENPYSDGPSRTDVAIHSHCSLFRVYPPDSPLHMARLVRRDPALEAALRRNGLTIPALDPDEDRR